MPRTSTAPAKKEPEYRLLVVPHVAERTGRPTTMVVLETTKAFATFRYELSVRTTVEPHALHLAVLGFRTPRLSLPSAGPARFEEEYEQFGGPLDVTIQGIDGRSTTFQFEIGPGTVTLTKKPRGSFVHIATDLASWHSTER